MSFANGIRTADGGTHVDGLRSVVARGVNSAAKRSPQAKTGESAYVPGEYVREGLTQGRKRVRNSQLQRLISRSFFTRFG